MKSPTLLPSRAHEGRARGCTYKDVIHGGGIARHGLLLVLAGVEKGVFGGEGGSGRVIRVERELLHGRIYAARRVGVGTESLAEGVVGGEVEVKMGRRLVALCLQARTTGQYIGRVRRAHGWE